MILSVEEKLDKFFSRLKKHHYKKGELILRGGDIPQGIYFIDKGYVRSYSISPEGEELTLIIYKPKDYFPMRWIFGDKANRYYYEAMTGIDACHCPREEFVDFLKSNPDVLFNLTGRITTRAKGLMERMEYLAFGNAYQKVASILLICADRFGEENKGEILIPIPLTHKDIAMLVGMTRETVSIEVKKLERKGIIDYSKHLIVVKDVVKLSIESLAEDRVEGSK